MKNKNGRKFKCIGLIETAIADWNDSFTIDKIYCEAIDNLNLVKDINEILILLGDYNKDFCVDRDQFELIVELNKVES